MEILKLPELFDSYSFWLIIIGISIFAASLLPRKFSTLPIGMPIIILALGYLSIELPLELEAPDLMEKGTIVEHITELGVIITLMAAGLKIDRRFSFKGWEVTWRLLSVTMLVTVALTFLAGWWLAAFVPATAMLFGAVIAPTDSLMAVDVEVAAPNEGAKDAETGRKVAESEGDTEEEIQEEDDVRFAVTTEAGFNDGLAFPFTNLAILMALFGAHPSNYIETWLIVNVLYEIGVGVLAGLLLACICAKLLFRIDVKSDLSRSIMGMASLAFTLFIYGVTEFFGGYGFLAVFIGAVTIRQIEPAHYYHKFLYVFIEKVQRILMVIILLGLGAAIGGDLFEPLNPQLILTAIVVTFLIRPVSGIMGLVGMNSIPWRDRLGITFLIGIRGFGAVYYLSYALNRAEFPQAKELYALVALIIVLSLIIHGIFATPVVEKLDKMRKNEI